jgi:hypothetical protein
MKPYIDFNTKKRSQPGISDFEKDFFKLMNNAAFGKTMENLRNRVDIKLVNNEKKLTKLTSKANFKRVNNKINDSLIAVEMGKTNLMLSKPIYVGASILDQSKILMANFHYEYIKKAYGDKAKLLFTDTDSLCYVIETEDVLKCMQF